MDLVIRNAHLHSDCPDCPDATALAIQGDAIVALGTESDADEWIRRRTQVLDACGGSVLPGFNEAHAHLLSGGRSMRLLSLRDVADRDDFRTRIGEAASTRADGDWITGGQWDHESWPGGKRPDRELIDPVTPSNPVLFRRLDGHIAVANSHALRLADVTAATVDPPGGSIERDVHGEPTGILCDTAIGIVSRLVPDDSADAQRGDLSRAMVHALSLGVTSVQTPVNLDDVALFRNLRQQDTPFPPTHLWINASSPAQIEAAGQLQWNADPWLHGGAVKLFADGSFGARTALLFEPYSDAPGDCGLAVIGAPELEELVTLADSRRLQCCIHAIGDRAVSNALDAIGSAQRRNGRREARHRVEHAQCVRAQDRLRFASLAVVASLQPSHCTDDMRWIHKRLGDRCRSAYPHRSLLDAGAWVALGTDWAVEPLDPLPSVYAAVTRQFADGSPAGGWHPEECVTLPQALHGYAGGSAYAEFRETCKGRLAPRYLADVVVLDAHLREEEPQAWLQTRVRYTVLGGRVVYRQ